MQGIAAGCTIRRVKLRGSDLDALTASHRLASRLDASDLQPRGLSHAAILCVRRMNTRHPLDLHDARVIPEQRWQTETQNRMDEFLRQAKRPAVEPVLADAVAVVFRDEAEMLACLALDWLAGRVAERWWWPALLGTRVVATPLQAWRAAPMAVPAALALIADRGRCHEFVRHLNERDIIEIMRDVATRFRAERLLQVLGNDSGDGFTDDLRRTKPDNLGLAPSSLDESHDFSEPENPWQCAAPEAVDTASICSATQQLFLGVLLTLARRPTLALSQIFANDVRTWRVHRAAKRNRDSTAGSVPTSLSESAEIRTEVRCEVADQSSTRILVPGPSREQDLKHTFVAAAESTAPTRRNRSRTPDVVETELGGLFYLLNLAIYARLYGDFTTPDQPGLPLSPWDFLTLTGRCWLEAEYDADPLWALLAKLSGRAPDEPPGVDFEPDPAWRFPEGQSSWSDGETSPGLSRREEFPGVSPSARDWLLRMASSLSTMIAARTGIDVTTEPQRLLQANARVQVTPLRVDVLLSLDELPICVRLAGLDRDPGWLPAAGRTIAFHFSTEGRT